METYETTAPWIIYSYLTTDEESDANGGEGRVGMRCSICGVDEDAPAPAPTHCVKGHYAQWCDCRTFVAAAPGRYTSVPTIRYPNPMHTDAHQ